MVYRLDEVIETAKFWPSRVKRTCSCRISTTRAPPITVPSPISAPLITALRAERSSSQAMPVTLRSAGAAVIGSAETLLGRAGAGSFVSVRSGGRAGGGAAGMTGR